MTLIDFDLPTLEEEVALPGGESPSGATVAASMIAAAQRDAAAIREAARAEGHAEGLAVAQAEVASALAALETALQAVADEGAAVAEQLEADAVELSLAVAEQVLQAALQVDPTRVVDAVRGALRRLVERGRVTVLVHPFDLDLVRDATPVLLDELGGVEHCEVQADRRVARGGAVVRTADGEVDATIETKLARAREAVRGALAEDADGA